MLQDQIIDIFIIQRENYFGKFVQQISKSNETVSKEAFIKLKKALEDEIKLRCKAVDEKESAINIIKGLTTTIHNLNAKIEELTRAVNSQTQFNLQSQFNSQTQFNPQSQFNSQFNSQQVQPAIPSKMNPPEGQNKRRGRPRKVVEVTSSSDGETDEEELYRRQKETIAARYRDQKRIIEQANRISDNNLINENKMVESDKEHESDTEPKSGSYSLDAGAFNPFLNNNEQSVADAGPSKSLGFMNLDDDPGFG
jgi:hypothetical protein